MACFVDTSAFYALADRADPEHVSTTRTALAVSARGLVTTDYVLVETFLLLEARLGHAAALRFWGGLRAGAAALVGVLATDLARAWSIVHEWSEHELGIVDATSFAVMERMRIRDVLTCDEHFRIYRYGPSRKGRFRVLP